MASNKIPSWILPTSYLIIIGIMAFSFFTLYIIPYKRTISVPIIIYQPKNEHIYGEIQLQDICNLHLNNIVNIKIESKFEKHYYQANVTNINYNQDLNCYFVYVGFPKSKGLNTSLISNIPLQGDAEIMIENSNMLYYLLNYINVSTQRRK